MERADLGSLHRKASAIYVEGSKVVLQLARRKNRPRGSVLRRSCWCSTCTHTCPIHVLWPMFAVMPVGHKPFENITPAAALGRLRHMLAAVGVEKAGLYCAHDLRRGHARDLQAKGASLYTLLSAGEWASPAFTQYIDKAALEDAAVEQAHVEELSDWDE